ncbi:MAG TPA: rod shape-determining protein MreC [Anaerolineae bacterium]|nr:rod shape-determining protein MreC [Anaerolineae bacterium]MCB0223691.1 rod shape-determining protein MreC [Anaerolineae bacterium]HRV95008.1 rod shape-determining protein MreC [Anaerolineae bacterium]
MAIIRNRQIYIALIIALVLLGFGLEQLGYLSPLTDMVQTFINPIQAQMSRTADFVSGQVEQTTDIRVLQERNAELESLANSLMVENVRLKDLERENEILRQLLNYTRNNPQFTYQTTTIRGRSIGRDPTNLLYFIFLDVGARDGVAKDMPVITDRGLVGRVTAVGPNSAQVLMLIDPSSAVNALIQNSRVTGLVKGNIDGTLTMERIPPGEEVNPGDIVLTSGLGGNFPDKLVIGQVTEVTQRDQDMFQIARIRPTVDFGKLETMLVITSFEPVDFEAEIIEAQEPEN